MSRATVAEVRQHYQPRQQHGHLTLSNYREPLIQDLIVTNKFSANRRAAELLGGLLSIYLHTNPDPITLVPIPLSSTRYRERGHNQTTTILQHAFLHLQHSTNIQTRHLLRRTRDTPPQTSRNRDDRRVNVQGAFSATHWVWRQPAPTIYLVDDVVTTGNTLRAAKTALQERCPTHRIYTLALARS